MENKTITTSAERFRKVKYKNIIDERTISVLFEKIIKHPRYHKFLTRTTKLLVHVPEGASSPKVDDIIEIISSKPVSKTKKWTLK